MRDLSQLLTAQPFPDALPRVQQAFARQPDNRTCGAAAIRHGLLLGGLTFPGATLEALLDIRTHDGTPPATLRKCLRKLGLHPLALRKPKRTSTRDFLDGLADEFAKGAFLIPCVRDAEHWVCLGSWDGEKAGVIDSFFDRRRMGEHGCRRRQLVPSLTFISLSPEQLDGIDWAHHVTLVRPGHWSRQYRHWHPARSLLLKLPAKRRPDGVAVSMADAIREGAHQYLDDLDYSYRRMELTVADAGHATLFADDPGQEAIGVETRGRVGREVTVLRRLGGCLRGGVAVPEVVMRTAAVRVSGLGR